MSVDRNIVGWIGKDEVRPFLSDHQVKNGRVTGVPADQTMAPETPNVTRPRDRGGEVNGRRGDVILGLGLTPRRALACILEHDFDLFGRKARELDFEVVVDEALQLYR